MLVVVLPITTFPLVMKLTGSSSVAPASLLFLIPLIAILLPFVFIKKIMLPVHVKALLLSFCLPFGHDPDCILTSDSRLQRTNPLSAQRSKVWRPLWWVCFLPGNCLNFAFPGAN